MKCGHIFAGNKHVCEKCNSSELGHKLKSRGDFIAYRGVLGGNIGDNSKLYNNESYVDSCNKVTRGASITRGVATAELLVDVELIIHIMPEDQKFVDIIYNSLVNPKEYISLGRREDIVRVDEVKIVSIEDSITEKATTLEMDAYIPVDMFGKRGLKTSATIYTLTKKYDKVGIKKDVEIRKWDKVKVVHGVMNRNEITEKQMLTKDEDNYLVFFA
jgi:CRISPR-associated protein Cas5t